MPRPARSSSFTIPNTRADCKISLSRSMQHLRDLINCNTAEPENCLWVTLTYRENMRDTRRLYDDLRKFFMRLQYHLQKNGLPHCKYILVAEPQGRGAWHAHAILIFPEKAPYIDNTIIARLWGHGFVTVKSLSGVVNAGVYLSAYLGGLELSEAAGNGPIRADQIKEVETVGQDGKRRKRRLSKECGCVCTLPDSRLFRCSRGLKKPEIIECTEREALREIGAAKLIYEKTLRLTNENGGTVNLINYRQFRS